MKIREITRPEMDDAKPLLYKAGWNFLGSGAYADVFEKPGVNYILKLFEDRDNGYKRYLSLISQRRNKHFPILRGRPMKINSVYWAVRMEKLQPINSTTDWEVVANGERYLRILESGSHEYTGFVQQYVASYPDMAQALELILRFVIVGGSYLDLGYNNVMKRLDGTLVIIDPAGGGR